MRSFMDGAVGGDDSDDNQSAAQPGATALLREPSRANVPDLSAVLPSDTERSEH